MRNLRAVTVAIFLSVFPAFSQPYTITTVAGTNRLLDGQPATTAPLRAPCGVVVDRSGNLYVADRDDNRVRKITPANVISTFAGTGLPGYTGDRGKATQATLTSPVGLAVDSTGNVYIADRDNYAVRRVSPDGTINTAAGNGTPGFSGDNAAATSAQLQPWAVAVDSQGNLYIADGYSNRIRKVNTQGIISTIAGNGGTSGYSGDSSSATTTSIDLPTGIATELAGNVYIASFERALEITPSGTISTVAGSGNFGYIIDGVDARQAVLIAESVALDGKGGLYLSDANANKVRSVDLTTFLISSVVGNGSIGFSGDQNPASSAELTFPYGLAFDAAGDLYIADVGNERVREVLSSNSNIVTVAGTSFADGSPATSAFLNHPFGLAIDATNNTVVADTGDYEVRRYAPGGSIGPFGQLPPFTTPLAVALDQSGNFYISDLEPRVLKTTSAGVTTIIAGNGTDGDGGDQGPATQAPISQPSGVAVDAAGNVYFTDYTNKRIRKVNTQGVISTIAGTGNPLFSGDNGAAISAGIDPFDIAFDRQGNLYVADQFNNRIRKIGSNGTITTVAGTGKGGYAGDGGLATAAQLSSPKGVAIDSAGNLYIADNGNSVVRRVNAGGLITTIAGNGQMSPATGDGGPAILAQISPVRVAVDLLGDVYITDGINDRIRKLTPQPIVPAMMAIVSGNNQQGSTGAPLNQPLVVKVTDRTGVSLSGVIVSFTAAPSASATVTVPQAITLNDGTASTGITLGSTVGTVTITASVSGISSVAFSVSAISATAPVISAGGIVSAGLSTPAVTALAVNSIASIFGSQFAPAGTALQVGTSDLVNGMLPTSFGGVCVMFGSVPAPIFAVYPNQINFQVPQVAAGSAIVQVTTQCNTLEAQPSNVVVTQIDATAPEFFYFTHTSTGNNAIAAVNAVTGAYIGAPGLVSGGSFTPAKHGDYLTLYATGFGATNPSFSPGELPGAAATVTAPYSISWGGVTLDQAHILYVGVTSNAGVYQVNIQVPDTIPSGDQPFIITIGGVSSLSTAYITVAASQ